MNIIKLGIIGAAGKRGGELFQLFSQLDKEVRITAVADTNLESLSERFKPSISNSKLFTDEAEFFSSADVDAVIIATPDFLHEKHACAALNAGKHVYLEKPMAITPEGCDEIIKTAEQSHRILYVGHNLRHFTVIKKIKEVIDSGAIGEVKAVWCLHPISYGRRNYFNRWHQDRANTGSLLIHKASHDLDIIHWFAGGHTKRVVAMGSLSVWGDQPGSPNVEDLSSLIMTLDNGVQATYSQCHFAHLACREYMIIGTKGTVRNQDDNPERAVVQLFGKRRADAQSIPTEEWRFQGEKGFHGDADKRIVNEFVGIIRGTATPTISIKDAAWAVKTGYAATQSLRNGNIPIDVA